MKIISKYSSLILTYTLLATYIDDQNYELNVTSNILIEEVVVTARKKEETAQDVPIALSAMNQEQLEILK